MNAQLHAILYQLIPTAVGIWLMVAPSALGYVSTSAEMNDRIIGPFIATFAIIAMGASVRNVRFWNVPIGVWMIIAAFLFEYPGVGVASALVAGVIVAVHPWKGRVMHQKLGGSWAALFKHDAWRVTQSGASADAPATPNPSTRDRFTLRSMP